MSAYRMDETTQNFDFFKQKPGFFKNRFWQSAGAILENVSAAYTIV